MLCNLTRISTPNVTVDACVILEPCMTATETPPRAAEWKYQKCFAVGVYGKGRKTSLQTMMAVGSCVDPDIRGISSKGALFKWVCE